MSDLEEKLHDLSVFYEDQELAQLTESQLNLDLNYCNVNLPWTLNLVLNIEDVQQKLLANMPNLIHNRMSDLMNLLYKADVNEKEINRIFDIQDQEMRANQMSWAIVNRELKKVIIRQHYSSGS